MRSAGAGGSLWNERAVAYRAADGTTEPDLALAVIVQRMVAADAAGVLFTADPITGRRHRAVIDVARGLGEAVVSGHVDPDHLMVDPASGRILARRIRGDRAVLPEAAARTLVSLGTRIERHFGAPQDIEFAVDRAGTVWIVQSRAITTLYPLPARLPDPDTDLRVLLSFNVVQGYFPPITPLGLEVYRLLGERVVETIGGRRSGAATPRVLTESGLRAWLDLTPVVRDRVGRRILERLLGIGEARSVAVIHALAGDARLRERRRPAIRPFLRVLRVFVRTGVVGRVLRALRSPERTRLRLLARIAADAPSHVELASDASAEACLDRIEELIRVVPPIVAPRAVPIVIAGVLSYVAAGRLLGDRARADELQVVTRGLPHNPTTEMDLALWAVADAVRRDRVARETLLGTTPASLAAGYHDGTLPEPLQTGLASVLARFGYRSIGEIDIGVARWSEDPTHLLGALANHARLADDALAPDARFAAGTMEAEAMIAELLGRVDGPRRQVLGFFLRRVRALMGAREEPKANLVARLLTPVRSVALAAGARLAADGRLDLVDDVFFLTLTEARRAARGEDLRTTVARRRATFERERRRRHVPRILLSDGTDAELALDARSGSSKAGDLRGTTASPGRVTGAARVILSPVGAHLEPGEILVAPSTDPGWTPLFLTAGGLVMEMGGMMSHGAVVAREYGHPGVGRGRGSDGADLERSAADARRVGRGHPSRTGLTGRSVTGGPQRWRRNASGSRRKSRVSVTCSTSS